MKNKPFVSQMFGAFQESMHAFIVLRLEQNTSLSSLLQRHQILQLESARYVIVDMLIGLHHLHSIGFLHGDLKPQNVLIDCNNRAIIGDFGLVLDFKNNKQKGIYGTPLYQSPEQLEDKYHLDERVDIFNVGVIFYEMIVGIRRSPSQIICWKPQQTSPR